MDDAFERHADEVADQVASGLASPEPAPAAPVAAVQRDAGAALTSSAGGMVDPHVGAQIHAARGHGHPLPDEVRTPMERALGNDFSGVRVHTGPPSERLNQTLGSNAFTTGRDIFFGAGHYAPQTPEGQRLIAHELTHVVQQGAGAADGVQRSPVVQRNPNRELPRSNPKRRVLKRTFDFEESRAKRRNDAMEQSRQRGEALLAEKRNKRTETAPTSIGFGQTTTFSLWSPSFGSPSFGQPFFEPPSSFGPPSTFGSPSFFDTPWSLGPQHVFGQTSFPGLFPTIGPPPTSEPSSPFASSEPFSQYVGPGLSFGLLASTSDSAFEDVPLPTWDASTFGSYREPQEPSQAQIHEEQLARGEAAKRDIEHLARTVNDTEEMADYFDLLQFRYDLQWIDFVELGTPRARVVFKINPEFEVLLGGTHLEMRAQGSDSKPGVPQTKVEWKTSQLTLDGQGDYIVGTYMLANPLSMDHPTGTESKADTDQKWMSLLPSASGSSSDGYVKGHLLNHDLGGIANQQNLFPITGWANGQHKTYAEQYIKSGINNGYVYAYRVDIGNITEGVLASGEYYVNADLHFNFARLDATGNVVPKTHHKGTVKSRYETQKQNRPAGPWPDVKAEYANDYTGGKKGQPKTVGKERIYKHKQADRGTSNAGLVKTLAKGNAFTYGTPDAFGSNPFAAAAKAAATAKVQSLAPGPPPVPATMTGRLSLMQSTANDVETHFAKLVNGWNATDIGNWVKQVQSTPNLKKWEDVEALAVKNHLDSKVAGQLFDVTGPGRAKVSINGKP